MKALRGRGMWPGPRRRLWVLRLSRWSGREEVLRRGASERTTGVLPCFNRGCEPEGGQGSGRGVEVCEDGEAMRGGIVKS